MDKNYRIVTKGVMKKDAMQLVTGKAVYTNDIAPKECLLVKLMRSPHAHAIIEDINTSIALKVKGVEAIYTYKDVPQKRFTIAGQTYPELSPYDRLILDKELRFVGDPVAIIAAETEKAAEKAMKLIKVKYKVLPAVLDYKTALDNETLVHPEQDWNPLIPFGGDNKRNLVAHQQESDGDVEDVFSKCDIIIEDTYESKQNNQAMMESFRTFAEIDKYGRLHVTSSTQIVFHCRRIIANALDIPKSKVRVTNARLGGGFGAKQSAVSEVYPAFVTWMTKKPSKILYSREETLTCGSPRHPMQVHVKLGATNDGTIKAIDLYTLSNSGAYSEHGPTTVGLSGAKSIPLYTGNLEAYRFTFDVVYTNLQASGAYRGYGAPQGIFAVETTVNQLAAKLNMDPSEIREKNMLREGQIMPAYHFEQANACALDKCMAKAKEMFNWEERKNVRDMGNGKVRAAGVALAMQGSCIENIDVGSATVKLTEDGTFSLLVGSADMGTGADTILSQVAAETLECELDDIQVFSADTDISPYDSGSYASSTTYITGKATFEACNKMKENLVEVAAGMLKEDKENLLYSEKTVKTLDGSKSVSTFDIANNLYCGGNGQTAVTITHSSPVSPPPYMVGMAEIELDKQTGVIEVLDYVAVVDCGTVMNENLARIQVEGGILQGIGMALYEDVNVTESGRIIENSLMNYKIPTRLEVGKIRVAFESSYEETGPYGAKSIGEIVINTPCPAINNAIYNATGHFMRKMPFTPERVFEVINGED